jgi:hypothetical protein
VIAVLALTLSSRSSLADDAAFEQPPAVDGPFSEACPHGDGIVGSGCPRYGSWGAALEAPYVVVGIGFNMRRLPRTATTSTTARSSEPSGSTIEPFGADTSYTVSQTIGIVTSRVSYIGLDVEVSPRASETLAPGERAMTAGGALLLGLHGGGSSLKLGAELAAGGRIVDSHDVIAGEQFVLEVRAHGDLWITPWFTIGALIGTSLLDRGDVVTGIQLGFHSWSYGGNY